MPLTAKAPVETCAAAPATGAERFTHFAEFAPVFVGGVVLRGRGSLSALHAAIGELGVTGVYSALCPEDGFLAWLPGGEASVAAFVAKRGVDIVETIELSPLEGLTWLANACTDANRCEVVTRLADPQGLCGFTLGAIGVEKTDDSLARCRALPLAKVACVLSAGPGAETCTRALRAAVGGQK